MESFFLPVAGPFEVQLDAVSKANATSNSRDLFICILCSSLCFLCVSLTLWWKMNLDYHRGTETQR